MDSLLLARENSNGAQMHIAEGLQKRYLALVTYLLGDGLDFLVEGIKRSVQGNDISSIEPSAKPAGIFCRLQVAG